MTTDLRLLAAINRSLLRVSPVTLDPDRIEAHVIGREGISAVPGRHWRPAFEALSSSLETQAHLHPLGRVMANGQLVGLLRARCRAERLLSRHPEIRAESVARPIIIMGPMRSGSTRVQRLLACDPRLAWTRLYETLFPVPHGRGDPRRVAAAAAVHATLRTLNPAVQRIHPSGPTQPDEEFGYLSFAFHSGQFAVQWNVPDFMAQEETRDFIPVARDLKTLLQLNGWARGGVGARRWVLKCPAYSGMADALLTVFPDAQLICLERDPVTVVASSASLVFEQRRIHSDRVDQRVIGAEWLERTADRQCRLAAARQRHARVPAFDLDYERMDQDWEAVMRELYRFLEIPLTNDVRRAMSRYLASANAHHGHRYRLEDYGLSEAAVRAPFAQPGSRSASLAVAPAIAAE